MYLRAALQHDHRQNHDYVIFHFGQSPGTQNNRLSRAPQPPFDHTRQPTASIDRRRAHLPTRIGFPITSREPHDLISPRLPPCVAQLPNPPPRRHPENSPTMAQDMPPKGGYQPVQYKVCTRCGLFTPRRAIVVFGTSSCSQRTTISLRGASGGSLRQDDIESG